MQVTLVHVPPDRSYLQFFHVGKSYLTIGGKVVHVKRDNFGDRPKGFTRKGSHYRCVMGHDRKWRYCHEGRGTGCKPDDPDNFAFPPVEVKRESIRNNQTKTNRRSKKPRIRNHH